MDIKELIVKIAWPFVVTLGLVVLVIFKKPLEIFISNLRHIKVNRDKDSGFSVEGDVDRSLPEKQDLISLQKDLMVQKESEDIQQDTSASEEITLEENYIKFFFEKKFKESREVALKVLEKNKSGNPDLVLWLKMWAAKSLCFYDFSHGKEEFQNLLKEYPNDGDLYITFAKILVDLGSVNDAFSVLDKYPGDIVQKRSLQLNKAEILKNNGNNEDALSILEELGIQEDNINIKSKSYLIKGDILNAQGKNDDAIDCMYKAYKILPTDTSILWEIAQFFGKIADLKKELFFRLQLNNIIDNNSAFNGYLGNTLWALGFKSSAMKAYERGNQIEEGKVAWLLGNIGNVFNSIGLYDKALEFFRRAIELDPSNKYVHDRLATTLANNEKEHEKVNEIENEVRKIIVSQTN